MSAFRRQDTPASSHGTWENESNFRWIAMVTTVSNIVFSPTEEIS